MYRVCACFVGISTDCDSRSSGSSSFVAGLWSLRRARCASVWRERYGKAVLVDGPEPDMKGLQRCVRASDECCRLAGVAFDAQEPPVCLLCSSCARLHTPRQRHLPARWDERGGENVTACSPCPARRTHISSLRMMGSAWGTRSETSALGRAEGGSRAAPQGPPGGSTATPPGPTWPCLCPGV